jgi:hypothetical protein
MLFCCYIAGGRYVIALLIMPICCFWCAVMSSHYLGRGAVHVIPGGWRHDVKLEGALCSSNHIELLVCCIGVVGLYTSPGGCASCALTLEG